MTKEEIIEMLKESLELEVDTHYHHSSYYGETKTYTIKLLVDGVVISAVTVCD